MAGLFESFTISRSSNTLWCGGGGPVIRRSAGLFTFVVILFPVVAASTRAQLARPSAGMASSSDSGASSGAPELPPPPEAQISFSGSVPSQPVPGVLHLSLQDAIQRGLKQNLGLLLSGEDVDSARGERWKELSHLLPNLTTSTYMDDSKADIAEFGFSGFPGVPSVVGPFAYFDSRAYLTQSVFDWNAINKSRAAGESVKASRATYQDARDLVVLAVGYAYVQAVADQARVDTVQAQVNTAEAIDQQASDQLKAGTSPAIDGLRAQVELQSRQQELIQAKNGFAIQKLALARTIGLAPGQNFELMDKTPYQPVTGLSLTDALKRAYASRSDYQAEIAAVRAAEFSRKAAAAEYLPSLSFDADYGLAGTYPNVVTAGIFDVRGTLKVPIFQGGKVHGDILAADARLQQSRARLENLRSEIDAQVRTAFLNLESAEQQVAVARSSVDLAEQALVQARDRFRAGVTNTVEVVQAQESVARANENYISSIYLDNYAKISLARALGLAENGVTQFFKGN
jgi:outer membrane protein TolC